MLQYNAVLKYQWVASNLLSNESDYGKARENDSDNIGVNHVLIRYIRMNHESSFYTSLMQDHSKENVRARSIAIHIIAYKKIVKKLWQNSYNMSNCDWFIAA